MNLRADKTGNVIVLSPPVRVDHANATEFGEGLSPWIAACKREGCGIVLDMQGVEYISSVGLRALMLAAKQIRAQGGRIGIAAPTPVVREVFEISRFHLVIPVYDSVPAAVAEVGAAA